MVAAVAILGVGRAPELAPPDDQGVFEQATRPQVGQQTGDRPVDGSGMAAWSAFKLRC